VLDRPPGEVEQHRKRIARTKFEGRIVASGSRFQAATALASAFQVARYQLSS